MTHQKFKGHTHTHTNTFTLTSSTSPNVNPNVGSKGFFSHLAVSVDNKGFVVKFDKSHKPEFDFGRAAVGVVHLTSFQCRAQSETRSPAAPLAKLPRPPPSPLPRPPVPSALNCQYCLF